MSLVSTEVGHIQRAIDIYNKGELWFGIGKKTAWGTPDTPPVYDPINTPVNNIWWSKATDILETIGYKKVDTLKLVIPDVNGIIEVFDEAGTSSKWSEVSAANAVAQGARYLYISCLLDNTLPFDTFRQTGLFSNLTKKVGIPVGRTYLLPAEVESPGVLELILNHDPQPRSAGSRQRLQCIYGL